MASETFEPLQPMRAERQRLIRSLFDAYIEMYASRDDRLTTLFSENFSGYAGSSDVLVTDRDEWVKVTRQDFAQVPGRIRIEILDLALQDLADDVVAVTAFFHIHLPLPENVLAGEVARLVLIFRCESGDWKIAHSGISIPYGRAGAGEVYPMSRLEVRNRELERIVEIRTRELADANRQLEVLSNTDGLTHVGNRRFFDQQLQLEWNRAQRGANPLGLILLDIDNFKHFNDHYGHLAGDACLQALAKLLAQTGRRAGEQVARYGGEEFVVLLPTLDKPAAQEFALGIQQAVLALAIPHAGTPLGIVSVSLGVASLPASIPHKPVELLQQADAALYRAKAEGRNCVRVAG